MGRRRIPLPAAVIVSALLVLGMFWLRLAWVWRFNLPIGYGVPLVIIASFRRRSLLWGAVTAFFVLGLFRYFFLLPSGRDMAPVLTTRDYLFADLLVTGDLVVIGIFTHLWIRNQDRAEGHAAQLEAVNAELRSRESQVAQSNEQLQSQSDKLERQSAELRRVIAELDLRRREAEEASIRKTRFLAAVSHDIRTPANAISLLSELVRRTAANPDMAGEVPELADELHSSAVSLVNLLTDVLDIARFDSGKIELQETEFWLGDFLEDACRQMTPLAREKHLELTCHPPPMRVCIRADRIKLGRVLGNLIGNAIKFTDTGSVKVQADAPDESGIVIRVIDTGVGIQPEFQRHIFDEFFQIRNPERDRNKGTGLGLTICKRIADAMGGVLGVISGKGQGSTFSVKLPHHCIVEQHETTDEKTG